MRGTKMGKIGLYIMILFCISFTVLAVPEKMNKEMAIYSSPGNLLTGSHDFNVTLRDDTSKLWTENFTASSTDGLYSQIWGKYTALTKNIFLCVYCTDCINDTHIDESSLVSLNQSAGLLVSLLVRWLLSL